MNPQPEGARVLITAGASASGLRRARVHARRFANARMRRRCVRSGITFSR